MSVTTQKPDDDELLAPFQAHFPTDLPSVDTLLTIDLTANSKAAPGTTAHNLCAFQVRLREKHYAHHSRVKDYRDLQKKHADLERLASAAKEHVTSLQLELAQARANNAHLAAKLKAANAVRSITNEGSMSWKWPEPDIFESGHKKWYEFSRKLNTLFDYNADHYPSEQAKLAYLFSRVDGPARDALRPHFVEGGKGFEFVHQAMKKLDKLFNDPDYTSKARQKIRTLKQGNRDFGAYDREFMSEILWTDWDDSTKASAIVDGLSSTMLGYLMRNDWRKLSFLDLQHLLRSIDSDVQMLQERFPDAHDFGDSSSEKPDDGNNTKRAPNPAPALLNGRLAPEERQRRMAERLCLYCGGEGHQARTCPRRPANKNAAA